jgi:CheY-like chemotaxis protein
MTSHEMRNPLSAILHCTDEILGSIQEITSTDEATSKSHASLEGIIEAAETIAHCVHHQKRIVDDILTLSKLDSNLLVVAPVAVQPLEVVRQTINMFDSELRSADLRLSFEVDNSVQNLDAEWLLLDPSRVVQVLINLLTNAIKFTRTESKREITVNLSVSQSRPSNSSSAVKYVPVSKEQVADNTQNSETVFFCLSIKDTGRGLDLKEQEGLFTRFTQASPRTHVKYGGSGLGLFISRQLTELQGGQIGVISTLGRGSTFAFYVTSARAPVPERSSRRDSYGGIGRMGYADNLKSLSLDTAALTSIEKSELKYSESLPPVTEPTPLSEAKQALSEDINTAPLHVLVVEDNLLNQRVVVRQLRRFGAIVSVANHGQEALDFLKGTVFWSGNDQENLDYLKEKEIRNIGVSGIQSKRQLSVILMDLEMPVMDGLTCVKEIRKLESEGKLNGHVPVIAVTANAREKHTKEALEAGMVSINILFCHEKYIVVESDFLCRTMSHSSHIAWHH